MTTVITYGTFDMFHHGHHRLLERAKALGDYLIVGITSDAYDKYRGKLNVNDPLPVRMENVKASGFADEILVEEYEGQKIDDVVRKGVDVFAIGSDWIGQFDYLSDYCQVVYIERTRGISSTERRSQAHGLVHFGIVGISPAAERFLPESKFVSGVTVEAVTDEDRQAALSFADRHELSRATEDYDGLLARVGAVYVAAAPDKHYACIRKALMAGKHVLCEKPLVLTQGQARELFALAAERGLVMMESLVTAYCPGFQRLCSLAKSGRIGEIKSVDASLTRAGPPGARAPGRSSMTELFSYPALAVHRLLGSDAREIRFCSCQTPEGGDRFTRIDWRFDRAIAGVKLGLGVQSENDLIISGTRGYIYVPSPWWKTEYYEIRTAGGGETKKYYYEFIGNGMRYILVEFLRRIAGGAHQGRDAEDSAALAALIERYCRGGIAEIL